MTDIVTIPAGFDIVASVLGLGIAIIFHEVSHGLVAYYLGDPTAKYAGRLSLNPIKHIDLWGTIIIPILLIASNAGFVFGWAKPVPVNYYNLKAGKWGPVLVALAGPSTNFLLLCISGLLFRISPAGTSLPFLFATIGLINGILMLFNLIPMPPLDGSKILYLFLEKRPDIIQKLEQYGMFVLLAVLILMPNVLNRFVFAPAFAMTSFILGITVEQLFHIL